MANRIYRKQHTDEDVLTAARRRFDQLLERFDDAFVAFSGGKDSLVCLHLWKEARDRAGLKGPVKVLFNDEEILPDSVINFVDEYRRKDWVDLKWMAYPLFANKFLLGKVYAFVQWDPGREHVREIPEWAITPGPREKGPWTQYAMNGVFARKFCKGRVVAIIGLRAEESMSRYAANAQKARDNWLHLGDRPPLLGTCNPIYDWSEKDVFKFLGQEGIRYCEVYDSQLWNRSAFRVSTPMHTGSSKRIGQWRAQDPDFFGRVMKVFPEMLLQERYQHELAVDDHEPSVEALEEWIRASIAPAHLPKAMRYIARIATMQERGKVVDWPATWALLTSGTFLRHCGTVPLKG